MDGMERAMIISATGYNPTKYDSDFKLDMSDDKWIQLIAASRMM